MSQIDPDGHRRSLRTIKKTPKQQQIDDERRQEDSDRSRNQQSQSDTAASTKQKRTQQRTHAETLKAQPQAELDNADATVRMMYDVGDLPGLASEDPNYDLIRKIAQLTGKDCTSKGLTTQELQEILDNPMVDDLEVDEALEAPGKGGTSPANQSESPTNWQPAFAPYYPGIIFGEPQNNPNSSTAPSKHNRLASGDIPQPPGTITTHSKGSSIPPRATRYYSPLTRTNNTMTRGNTPSLQYPPAPPLQKPAPLAKPSPPLRTLVPNKGKAHTPRTKSGLGDATGQIQHPSPPITAVSELEEVRNELKAAWEAWGLRSDEVIEGQALPPDLAALATRLRECRYRYAALEEDTPGPQIQSHGGSTPTSGRSLSHSKGLEHGSINVLNASTSKATRSTNNVRVGVLANASSSTESFRDTLRATQPSRASSSANVSTPTAARKGAHAPPRSKSSHPRLRGSPPVNSEGQHEGKDAEDDIGDGKALDDDDDDEQADNGPPAGPVRSEKQKANKPILMDFSYEDRRVLKCAKYYSFAELLSRGMFKYLPTDKGPRLKHEEYVYKKAWSSACLHLGVDRPYHSIFGKWMSQRRSEYINHSTRILKVIVDRDLGFSLENPRRNILISKEKANRGCHIGPSGRAFHSPLVRKGVQALVFEPAHPYGIDHPDLFKTIPSRLIAYVCAMLQFIINGYRKGPWANDRLSAMAQGAFFRQFLKDYEREENASINRKAVGERYREGIYRRGKLLYETQQLVEDEPMPPAQGTWSSDMELESD